MHFYNDHLRGKPGFIPMVFLFLNIKESFSGAFFVNFLTFLDNVRAV